MKLSLSKIAAQLNLPIPKEQFDVTNITTDSRRAEEFCLFAALQGERCDGHDFVAQLDMNFDHIAFLVEREIEGVRAPQLVCKNVLEALADIAKLHLDTMPAIRLAVTGSVGKTTTKEMMACTLSAAYNVQKSLGNRNNELGMPLTAFSVTKEHNAVIFEMGMRGLGQIAYLAQRVRPKIGVITNIGTSHIEILGSRENICRAKMELASYIQPDGVLIVNGDEPLLREACDKSPVAVKTFGIDTPCDYQAQDIEYLENRTKFTIVSDEAKTDIDIPSPGRHTVYNALAAFAVAAQLGINGQEIAHQLSLYYDGGLRQNIYNEQGLVFFDDTYNASPESMCAALGVMQRFPNRKIAVLADMLELGDFSKAAHRQVGECCRNSGVDRLICYGEMARHIVEGADMGAGAVWCENKESALRVLESIVQEDDIILFKGSHAMQTGTVLTEFKKRWAGR